MYGNIYKTIILSVIPMGVKLGLSP